MASQTRYLSGLWNGNIGPAFAYYGWVLISGCFSKDKNEQHFEMLASSFAKLVWSKQEYLISLAQALAENKIFRRHIIENLEQSLKRTMLLKLDDLWEVWISSRVCSGRCQNWRQKGQWSLADSDEPKLAISNVNSIFFPAGSDEWKSRSSSLKHVREVNAKSKQKKPDSKALLPPTKIRNKRKLFKRKSFCKRKRNKGAWSDFQKNWMHDGSFQNHVSDHWIESSSERSEDYSDMYSDVLKNDTEDELNQTKLLRQCSKLGRRRGCDFTQGREWKLREKTGRAFKNDATKEFVHLVPRRVKKRENKELVNLVPQRSKRSGQMVEVSTLTANCNPERDASHDLPEPKQKFKVASNMLRKRYQIIVRTKEDKSGKAVVLGVEKQPPPQCAELLLCLDRLARPAAFGLKRKPIKAPTGEYWLKHLPELCNLRTKQPTYKIFSHYRKRYFTGKYARELKEE